VGGQRRTLAALPSVKRHGSIVQEAGWGSGPVWTGAENLAPTGFRCLVIKHPQSVTPTYTG